MLISIQPLRLKACSVLFISGKVLLNSNFRNSKNNDNNYDQVLDLMNGQCQPKKLTMENGSLVLFRGKDAIHRVTPTIGNRTRILSVLAYNSEPNVKLSETARMTFFGKLN